MSPRTLGWAWHVLWREGAGPMLWPILMLLPAALIQAIFYPIGGLLFAVLVVCAIVILPIAWFVIAVRHVRVAVETWQLRVPGCPRTVLWSVCSLASWMMLVISLILRPLQAAGTHWIEVVAFSMAIASIAALVNVKGLGVVLAVAVSLYAPRAGVEPQSGMVLAGIVLLVVVRVWWLARALRRGAMPAFLRRGWYVTRDDTSSKWQAQPLSGRMSPRRHSPGEAMRIMLGPLFALPPVWLLVCLAALAAALLSVLPTFASRIAAVAASWLCAEWFMTLAQRLATVLHQPQGESAELALLPGLGAMRQQRHTLLTQAVMRPLLYGGLLLVGCLAGYWVAPRIAPSPLQLVTAAAPPLTALVLFVSLSLGVVSGRFPPTNAWLRRWAAIVLLPATTVVVPVSSFVAVSAAFLLPILAGMAIDMIADLSRLRREPRVLCQ